MLKKRILVVDDEPQMVLLLRSMLEKAGYEVGEAFSAADGTRMINEAAYDLVLLDFLLEDSLGESVLKTIRSTENLKKIPVIVITAFSSRGVNSFISRGATDVLFKPLLLEELLAKIRLLIG